MIIILKSQIYKQFQQMFKLTLILD